jgi:hypothetical protein
MNDDILDILKFLGILAVAIFCSVTPLTGLAYWIHNATCHARWDATTKAEYGLFSGCMVSGIPEDAYVNKYPQITITKGAP